MQQSTLSSLINGQRVLILMFFPTPQSLLGPPFIKFQGIEHDTGIFP